MYLKNSLVIVFTALMATPAISMAIEPVSNRTSAAIEPASNRTSRLQPRIAKDPTLACNCPKNCHKHNGSTCKFKLRGNTLKGECEVDEESESGALICVA